MLTAERAVILFAHGARDAQWSVTLAELQALVQARRLLFREVRQVGEDVRIVARLQ